MAIGSIHSKNVAFCVHKLPRGTKKTVHSSQLLIVLNGVVRAHLNGGWRLDLGPGNLAYVRTGTTVEAPYDDSTILLLMCDPPRRKLLLTDYALRCNGMLVYDATPPTIVDRHSIIAPLLTPVAVGENGGPAIIVRPGELIECKQKCIVKPLEKPSRALVIVEE